MPETRDSQVEQMVQRLVRQAPAPPAFPAESERVHRHRRAQLVRGAGIAASVVLIVAVALVAASATSTSDGNHHVTVIGGTSTVPTTPKPSRRAASPDQLQPLVVLDRNDNANLIGRSFVADPTSGVWYLIEDRSGVHLDHLYADGSVRVISLPEAFTNGFAASSPVIAVDPDGTAWVVSLTDLAEVRPGATTARLIPLGPWPNHEIHDVRALASNGKGRVAVGIDDTTIVRIFNTASSTFSDLALPVGTDAESLRYLPDGDLAIGLFVFRGSDTVALIAAPDGSLSPEINVGDASEVTAFTDTAVLFGASRPTVLSSGGTTQPITLPADLEPGPRIGGVQLGHHGKLVVTTLGDLAILASASDPVPTGKTLPYPRRACGPISGQGFTGGATGSVTIPVCRIEPDDVTIGSDGSIWLFYSAQVANVPHLTIKRIEKY